jgi:membrane-bound serine protease (ClpP class)
MMSLTVAIAGLMVASLLIAIVWVAALSRHKKGATGRLNLMDEVGLVETALKPEGSVLIRGELWRARSRPADCLERGQSVRVVGASGHLLEVEPTPQPFPDR